MKNLNEQKLRRLVRRAILIEKAKAESMSDAELDALEGQQEEAERAGAVTKLEDGNFQLNDGRIITPAAARKIEAVYDDAQVDTKQTKAERAKVKEQVLKLKNGVGPGVGLSDTMTKEKARELAKRMYDATQGSNSSIASSVISTLSFGLADGGMGTNEAEVQAVLSDDAIQSKLDLSYVCHIYRKETPAGEEMVETLMGEYGMFSQSDFVENVKVPLSDLIEDDTMFHMEGDPITKAQLDEWREAAAAAEKQRKDAEVTAGEYAEGFVGGAGNGVAALLATQAAVGGVRGASIALAGPGARGIGTTNSLLGKLNKIFSATGQRTVRSLGQKGASNIAAGTGRMLVAREVGKTAVRAGLASLALRGAGGVFLSATNPLLWATAAFAIFDVFDLFYMSDKFTKEEGGMLTGGMYDAMNKNFKSAYKKEMKDIEKIIIYKDPDMEEIEKIIIDDIAEQEEKKKKEEAEKVYPVLPPGINGPGSGKADCIRRAQGVMNQYVITRNIEMAQIKEDGIEGPETLRMWEVVCNHILTNHPILSSSPAVGKGVHWPNSLSPALVGQYPGYTGDSCGFLRFILDGYYNNVTYGTSAQAGGGGAPGQNMFAPTPAPTQPSRPAPQQPGGSPPPEERDGEAARRRTPTGQRGKLTYKNVIIGARSRDPQYANVDFLSDVNKSCADKMAMELVRAMKKSRLFAGGRPGFYVEREEVFNLSFKVKRNGTVKVKKFSGPLADAGRFEKPHRVLEDVIAAEMSSEEDAEFFRNAVLSITFPAGFYTSTVMNEAAIRKAVRKAVLRKLIL